MRRHVFADEAGDFSFNRHHRSSRYFILCTVTLDECSVGHKLLDLRRQLAWEKLPIQNFFHCCEDKQAVRDRVFRALQAEDFTIEATILEKSKAQPQTKISKARFYQYAWYYHFLGTHRRIVAGADEILITAASVMQKKEQAAFTDSIRDVMYQYYGAKVLWETDHPQSVADPCLQLVDYCTWAIQRKWERADTRSYDLIKDKIRHEYETWAHGTKHYY